MFRTTRTELNVVVATGGPEVSKGTLSDSGVAVGVTPTRSGSGYGGKGVLKEGSRRGHVGPERGRTESQP